MVMVANPTHHPDPNLISFSCRVVAAMRKLPPDERPNLIELLREYGRKVRPRRFASVSVQSRRAPQTSETFMQEVGNDFASGHREVRSRLGSSSSAELSFHVVQATGGIINKDLFEAFCRDGMEIGVKPDPEEGGGGRVKKEGKLEKGQQTLGGFFSSPAKVEQKIEAKAEEVKG